MLRRCILLVDAFRFSFKTPSRQTLVFITPPSPGRHNIVTATTKLNPPINSRTTEETTTAAAATAPDYRTISSTKHQQQHHPISFARRTETTTRQATVAAVAAVVGFTTPSSPPVQIRYITTTTVVLLSVLGQEVVEVTVTYQVIILLLYPHRQKVQWRGSFNLELTILYCNVLLCSVM